MVPKKAGSALETLTVSVLPVVERHAAPLVVKMTVEAVFVKPDHGVHLFTAGTVKLGATKVVPPPPKPPPVAMQKAPPWKGLAGGEGDHALIVDLQPGLRRRGRTRGIE